MEDFFSRSDHYAGLRFLQPTEVPPPFFPLIYSPLSRRFLADKKPPTWMVAQAIFILIGPSREVEATSHSSHGKIPPMPCMRNGTLTPSLAYFARQEQLLRSKRSFPYC